MQIMNFELIQIICSYLHYGYSRNLDKSCQTFAIETYLIRLTLQVTLIMVVIESRFGGDPAGRLFTTPTTLLALSPLVPGLKRLKF
jgi:hypothetical protein